MSNRTAFQGLKGIEELAERVNATGEYAPITINTVSCESTSFREGQFPIVRNETEQELMRLFDVYAPQRDNSWREYGEPFENDVFWVHPDYQHFECECEFEVENQKWLTDNPHNITCFQTYIVPVVEQIHAEYPLPNYNIFSETTTASMKRTVAFMHGKRPELTAEDLAEEIAYEAKRVSEHRAYCDASARRKRKMIHALKRIFKEWGITKGDSVEVKGNEEWMWEYICTCGRDKRHHEFNQSRDHVKPCEYWWADQPNFLHKPSGYGIHWYKYPCRDGFGTQEMNSKRLHEIINECVESCE